MKKLILCILLVNIAIHLPAQQVEQQIMAGNSFYRNKQYMEATDAYEKALMSAPGQPVARYNYASSLFRMDNGTKALTSLDTLLRNEKDNKYRQPAFYNTGSILSQQYEKAKEANKKIDNKSELLNTATSVLLDKSIEAYKNALRINPDDKQARENLQKALLEKKNNQPPPKKEDDKKKKQDQQKKPKPQPQMNQKEAEQRLKLLEQKEKQVQQRLQKEKSKTGGNQTKDW